MTKLEAIIQPRRLDAVKEALIELGVEGMTISDVRGHGRQKGHTEHYRGGEYTVDLLPKVKLEIVLPDDQVEAAVNGILKSAATGQIGDGKIFLSKIDDAIRIRNQERGPAAHLAQPRPLVPRGSIFLSSPRHTPVLSGGSLATASPVAFFIIFL